MRGILFFGVLNIEDHVLLIALIHTADTVFAVVAVLQKKAIRTL